MVLTVPRAWLVSMVLGLAGADGAACTVSACSSDTATATLECSGQSVTIQCIPPHVVFVTKTVTTGLIRFFDAGTIDFGIEAGDKICQQEAFDAGLYGHLNYHAWLSDDTSNAIDILPTGTAPIYGTNGNVVAPTPEDLLNGRISDHGAILYADATAPPGFNHTVWTGTANGTGTRADGTEVSCGGWLFDGIFINGRAGRPLHQGLGDGAWPSSRGLACSGLNSLLCIPNY
jgi:hypothetical protein